MFCFGIGIDKPAEQPAKYKDIGWRKKQKKKEIEEEKIQDIKRM